MTPDSGPRAPDSRPRRLRVAVLFGGRSGEHEVSLASAANVMAALDPAKYDVEPVGIDRAGKWLASAQAHALLSERQPFEGHEPASVLATLGSGGTRPVDVVFPVLHGPYGEDGSLQGFLEIAGFPYVGCGVLASALAMDKVMSKRVFREQGLPIADCTWFHARDWSAAKQREVEQVCGYPCFVKPANLGSSVGVSKAHGAAELAPAVSTAARFDTKIVVERAVPQAREIECSVLGNDQPRASVPGEVVPSREFYDYAAKYIDGASELLIPAPLEPALAARIQATAIRAFQALDCSGMARVDFLLDRGTGELFLNELNTIPGFTAISMYPKLWDASGLPPGQLVDRLVELARERHQQRAQLSTASN
ncbi:MAG TPA: D-alanine--D-alanine ligase family protein [Chloroflexota bacterium]|nr:D-alanine--D-alanine ligase family protein [Chloroflexota bacterium]